ncbi:hypothetical protein DUGA2_17490 [Duganella sp. HH101]|nr:hypothetical protein DUGA2_17490 [Duganella sp. HH101]
MNKLVPLIAALTVTAAFRASAWPAAKSADVVLSEMIAGLDSAVFDAFNNCRTSLAPRRRSARVACLEFQQAIAGGPNYDICARLLRRSVPTNMPRPSTSIDAMPGSGIGLVISRAMKDRLSA